MGRLTHYRVRHKRLILAYHGIIPDGAEPAGERALFVKQRDFAMQLDVLADVADVVPLDCIDESGDGQPRVAITFDDAYRGAVQQGVEELVKRSLPATIFVAPGRLNDHVFWWDALAHESKCLDRTLREYALANLEGADERVRQWADGEKLKACDSLPSYARSATRDELAAAVAFPGITVGSHTWSHRNLARLPAGEVMAELQKPHDWLRREFGDNVIPWLAYPYGLDSAATHAAAATASYHGALLASGGWYDPNEGSLFSRPRLSVGGGLSVAGLQARLVGATLS